MDVVVHTSLREGLARVLPQALACANPVVSFDVDGAKLKDGIIKVLKNPDAAERMGREGREHVSPLFG